MAAEQKRPTSCALTASIAVGIDMLGAPVEPQNDLDRFAIQHKTDKFNGHFYTPHYHTHFNLLRDQPLTLLEIGIGGYGEIGSGGESLRMWRDYFPQAQIHGLDVHPKLSVASDRISVHQGSQADPRAIARVLSATPDGAFDIVIDDASHRPELTIASFLMLFQFVAENGWYVIEDTETDHYPDFGGSMGDSSQFSIVRFFTDLAAGMNWRERDRCRPIKYAPSLFDQSIRGISFYRNIIFVQKGDNV